MRTDGVTLGDSNDHALLSNVTVVARIVDTFCSGKKTAKQVPLRRGCVLLRTRIQPSCLSEQSPADAEWCVISARSKYRPGGGRAPTFGHGAYRTGTHLTTGILGFTATPRHQWRSRSAMSSITC